MTDFKSRRATKTYKQINIAPPFEVFPLLCPVREADWLDGWVYKMIFTFSGLVEKGCIFSTPAENNSETTWYVTIHDEKNYIVEFVRMTPSELVVRIHIKLVDNNDGTTSSYVTYEYTSLNEKTDKWLENESDRDFSGMMLFWEASINHYLETGNKLA